MEVRLISKKEKKTRVSGHYWVKWAGLSAYYTSPDIWRMGSYQEGTGWNLIGDERIYYDTDFIEINENQIPFTKGRLLKSTLYYISVAAYWVALLTFLIIEITTK